MGSIFGNSAAAKVARVKRLRPERINALSSSILISSRTEIVYKVIEDPADGPPIIEDPAVIV